MANERVAVPLPDGFDYNKGLTWADLEEIDRQFDGDEPSHQETEPKHLWYPKDFLPQETHELRTEGEI